MRSLRRLGRLEFFILAVGLVAVLLVAYSTRLSSQKAQEGRLLEGSNQSLRSGVILSHLWLEEAVAGDNTVDVAKQVYGNIDRAQAECLGMLSRARKPHGTWAPVTDPMASATLGKLCAKLHAFDQLAHLRLRDRGGSLAGSADDQA